MDLMAIVTATTLFFKTQALIALSHLGLSAATFTVQVAAIVVLSLAILTMIGTICFGVYKLSLKKENNNEEDDNDAPLLKDMKLPPAKAGESQEYRDAVEALADPEQRGAIIAFEYTFNYKKVAKKNNMTEVDLFDKMQAGKKIIAKKK